MIQQPSQSVSNSGGQPDQKSKDLFRTLFIGLSLLIVFVLASLGSEYIATSARKKLDHALRLERDLGLLLSTLQDAESGQRGYLLTNQENYLEPYRNALDTVGIILEDIGQQVVSEKDQRVIVERVRVLTRDKFAEMSRTIDLNLQGDTAAVMSLVLSNLGYDIMRDIHENVDTLRHYENLSVIRSSGQIRRYSGISTFFRFIGIIGLAGVFYYIYSQVQPLVAGISSSNNAIKQANNRLSEANRQLTQALSERDAEIAERVRVEKMNAELIKNLNLKNKDLDQFAYIASHDLREPLRTMSNFIEVLREDHYDQLNQEGRAHFQFIHRASQRMTKLIETLLEFSQIGRSESLNKVDLNATLSEAVENLSLSIEESGAEISSEHLPIIQGYPVALRQLFQNLINNAIKFVNPGKIPRIEISCSSSEDAYCISFKDHGIGMSEADQKKIFTIFTRLNNSHTVRGQGIGLAFCQKIVALHEGTVEVISEPGLGSTFLVTIPCNLYDDQEVSPNFTD